MQGEFGIIDTYFRRAAGSEGLVLGIGDDGAVLRPREGMDQVVVTDTIVEGRHFPQGFAAADTGWRALAVNLSDIAAMGAAPRFAFLNLSLAAPDTDWLRGFAEGFFELADATGTVLAGGDTVQGPLAVTVTVIGELPRGEAVTRAGAKPGDIICVSGAPGEAAAGLELWPGSPDHPLARRFRRPQPRLALAANLREYASAAIDVSDGLAADLGHVLQASAVGARIRLADLPVSPALAEYTDQPNDYVLAGGDDYELCFCLPPSRLEALRARDNDCLVTAIGEIVAAPGLAIVDAKGDAYTPARSSWEHFCP